MILDTIANGTWGYLAGSSGTATIPAGCYALGVWCHASAAGATLTITPAGAKQSAGSAPSIPIPAGSAFSCAMLEQLGPGSVFVFTGTDSYFIPYAQTK